MEMAVIPLNIFGGFSVASENIFGSWIETTLHITKEINGKRQNPQIGELLRNIATHIETTGGTTQALAVYEIEKITEIKLERFIFTKLWMLLLSVRNYLTNASSSDMMRWLNLESLKAVKKLILFVRTFCNFVFLNSSYLQSWFIFQSLILVLVPSYIIVV